MRDFALFTERETNQDNARKILTRYELGNYYFNTEVVVRYTFCVYRQNLQASTLCNVFRTIRDREARTATSTFTQLLTSAICRSSFSVALRPQRP